MIDKFTLNLQDTSTHTSQRRRKPTYRNGLPKNTLAKNFPLLNLYPEILMMVMDRLPVQDIACMALSCKRFAHIATHTNRLTVNVNTALLGHVGNAAVRKWSDANSEFFDRLLHGWVPLVGPSAVGRCKRCSKFRSKRASFWVVSYFSSAARIRTHGRFRATGSRKR
jgi:hypothetical protein